jgi:hypothetical protein
MAYYTDLFSPETYEAFSRSQRDISGFRLRQLKVAQEIQVGDKFICYLTKVSRWFGILEVIETYFQDDTPIFYEVDDPFVVRFRVKPLVWLDKEQGIPIHEDFVWNKLSFTKSMDKKSSRWTGKIRSSLRKLDDTDGHFLDSILKHQLSNGKTYPLDEREQEKFVTLTVRRPDRTISVTVPQDAKSEIDKIEVTRDEVRESIKIQALIASIGSKMGMKIWLPKSDRGGVLKSFTGEITSILDVLPLNYDDATLKTIEQIDVLWLKGRYIVRAFEVEHTTSIYSGILRMADLLALQPNLDIKLHIVAPEERKEKVFQEIRRPVFSLLERRALSESCTYISYDSLHELSQERYLSHLSDSVLDDVYTEEAE